MKTYTEFSYLAYMQSVIRIYCELLRKLMNSYVRMTFDAVCHCEIDKDWGGGIVRYSCGGVYCLCDVTWNGHYGNEAECDFNICIVGTATLMCCVCICPSDGV